MAPKGVADALTDIVDLSFRLVPLLANPTLSTLAPAPDHYEGGRRHDYYNASKTRSGRGMVSLPDLTRTLDVALPATLTSKEHGHQRVK